MNVRERMSWREGRRWFLLFCTLHSRHAIITHECFHVLSRCLLLYYTTRARILYKKKNIYIYTFFLRYDESSRFLLWLYTLYNNTYTCWLITSRFVTYRPIYSRHTLPKLHFLILPSPITRNCLYIYCKFMLHTIDTVASSE